MDEKKVREVIAKANKGGFKWFKSKDIFIDTSAGHFNLIVHFLSDQALYYGFADVVFSHDFAKAFWGEDNGSPCYMSNHQCEGWHKEDRPKAEGYYPRWKFHLERMALQEDHLKYLARFL